MATRIAREVGVVSSAVYRYVPTREALLTAMILESYGHLAAALAAPIEGAPTAQWRTLATRLREWALSSPNEFQLIYGTPIPDYQAPPETIPAAASVAGPFLALGAQQEIESFADVTIGEQLTQVGTRSAVAAVVAELAAIIGFVNLELGGHLVGVADGDELYEALVRRQAATLELT